MQGRLGRHSLCQRVWRGWAVACTQLHSVRTRGAAAGGGRGIGRKGLSSAVGTSPLVPAGMAMAMAFPSE